VRNIVFIGPPGSGKGTQAARLCEKYGCHALSTGQLMRNEIQNETSLGHQLKTVLASGQLVDDALVMKLLAHQLQSIAHNATSVMILDGFPRTLSQAHMMRESSSPVHQVHFFDVDDEIIIQRLSGRRVHMSSGRTYHQQYHPPKQEGKDDITGEPLIQRSDDARESLEKRLKEYHFHTKPLKAYYHKLSQTHPTEVEFFCYDASVKVEHLFAALEQSIYPSKL